MLLLLLLPIPKNFILIIVLLKHFIVITPVLVTIRNCNTTSPVVFSHLASFACPTLQSYYDNRLGGFRIWNNFNNYYAMTRKGCHNSAGPPQRPSLLFLFLELEHI